ncbi:hypothetical protein ALT785_250042 [Alteromonas infernus]
MDPLLYPPVVLAPFLFTLLLLSMPIVKKRAKMGFSTLLMHNP